MDQSIEWGGAVAKRQGVGLAIQGSWVRAPAVTLLRNLRQVVHTPHCLIHAILHEEDCELGLLIKSKKIMTPPGFRRGHIRV